MKKIILCLLLGIFLISLTSASIEILGTFRQDDCIDLIQVATWSNQSNISSVRYPNQTIAVGDSAMNQTAGEFNFTFCATDVIGTYTVNGFSSNGTHTVDWAYKFEVTSTGIKLNSGSALLYLGLLAILIFLFIMAIKGITMLPESFVRNEEGKIMSVNNLKYLRPILYMVCWGLLLAIVFLTSSITLGFIGSIGNIIFIIYRIMFLMTLPIVVVWFIWIFASMFQDKEMKKMIERNVEMGGNI